MADLTPDEKARRYDLIVQSLTHRWENGRWSWWCISPCGGDFVDTRAEAEADLWAWAQRIAVYKARKGMQ